MFAHQAQVIHGGSSCAVPGGGLHPISLQVSANLAKPDLLLIIQVAIFKDNFDFLAGFVSHLYHRSDILANVIPAATKHLADVHHHVQFLAAIGNRLFGLGFFHGRGMATMRKTNRGAGLYPGSFQQVRTTLQVIRHDADAGNLIGDGKLYACFQIRDCQRRV